MDAFKILKLKDDRELHFYQDDSCALSPREWDNFGTVACWHTRYSLSDEDKEIKKDNFNSVEEIEEYLIKERNAEILIPIYIYDHSGITINTTGFSCIWDSGQCGFIYCTKEKRLKEKLTKKKAEEVMRNEIKTYDLYLTGQVYSYYLYKNVICDKCKHTEKEIIDSCCGYFYEDVNEFIKDIKNELNITDDMIIEEIDD